MLLDLDDLEALRRQHPAWRLLQADSAALVASFLHRVFVLPNQRSIAQADLAEALEDTLFTVRQQRGQTVYSKSAYPKSALEYLNDWAANDKAWLRKFYPPGSDEPHFDLTPATERALAWLQTLTQRSFVGTESRLLTLFELLRQISQGSQTDVELRVQELQRRRDAIDVEIERARSGDLMLLGDTALKERFAQFSGLARELLGDFREVEHNFRGLDRRMRERIALGWVAHLGPAPGKGALLQDVLGERDLIAESDQGRSFQAFWDFLMSRDRQDELSQLLDRAFELAPVAELAPDPRLKRVHYDWLEAGEHAQRTVALLSQQLRRFLDDQAYLENRRIMDILRGIEAAALALRETPPPGEFMAIDTTSPSIELAMERPLYSPAAKPSLLSGLIVAGDEELDADALYSQFIVDKAALASHVRRSLQQHSQVTLAELVSIRPLQQGLAELVAYLSLAAEPGQALIDDSVEEQVQWQAHSGQHKSATLPRVIFSR